MYVTYFHARSLIGQGIRVFVEEVNQNKKKKGKDSRRQIKDIVKNNVNDTHLNKTKKDSITETCYSMKSKISKLLKQQRKFSTQKILSKENFERILMEL